MDGHKKFDWILEQIDMDTDLPEKQVLADDDFLLESVSKEHRDRDPEYIRRNELYSELLEEYIAVYRNSAKRKKRYKLIFFVITLASFIGIVIAFLFSLVWIAKKPLAVPADIGVIAGSTAGVLSALLVIPKIIAEHLFPTNEDSNMIEMVKNMQLNDSAIRKLLDKEK